MDKLFGPDSQRDSTPIGLGQVTALSLKEKQTRVRIMWEQVILGFTKAINNLLRQHRIKGQVLAWINNSL